MNEFGSGAFREELLFAGLRIVNAWRMLNTPSIVGKLKSKEYQELCLDSGMSKEAAEKAANDWANKRLDANLEP